MQCYFRHSATGYNIFLSRAQYTGVECFTTGVLYNDHITCTPAIINITHAYLLYNELLYSLIISTVKTFADFVDL